MTELDNYSIESIETKIMSILYTNIDQQFSQFALFDKLIKDKYTELCNTAINPVIKAKFLLVIRNLVSRFDDIVVTKDNNVYSVVCLSSKDKLDSVKNYVQEQTNTQTGTQFTNLNTTQTSKSNVQSNVQANVQSNPNVPLDYIDLLDYIVDNDLKEDIEYVDPFDGNTIYHDLVITSNINKIKKLIETNKFNFFVKNKHNQTPFDLAKNQDVSNLLVIGTMKKYSDDIQMLNEKINNYQNTIQTLETKVRKYESKEYLNELIVKTNMYEIICIKLFQLYKENKVVFISLVIIMIAYFYIR